MAFYKFLTLTGAHIYIYIYNDGVIPAKGFCVAFYRKLLLKVTLSPNR